MHVTFLMGFYQASRLQQCAVPLRLVDLNRKLINYADEGVKGGKGFSQPIDPDFVPKDSVPENTERMTGGTQKREPDGGPNAEMGVGEMEGAKFKVEPLRRTGEDANTMRARLLCSHQL